MQAQKSGMNIPGVLESYTVQYSVAESSTPLLLSQAVQAKLGFRKDVRNGTIELIDYEGQSLKVVRQARTGLFMVRIDHLNPNTLVTHPGEVPIGLVNEKWQQDSRSHYLLHGKKPPRREKDPLDESDASSTLEFETTRDPTALMAKGDRDPGSSREYRPFMYDERVPMAAFEKKFLECPTIVVSLGILNFEDSNYSLRTCKDVQNYLGHMPESYDRTDRNTIFRKGTLEDDIWSCKRDS